MGNNNFELKRTNQCKTCPWIKGNNPFNIPNGYSEEKHKALKNTISDPNNPSFQVKDLHIMACHYSNVGNEEYCIGWLNNQLGAGNNIALRMRMMHCENAGEIKIKGEQHETFLDTLPKFKK